MQRRAFIQYVGSGLAVANTPAVLLANNPTTQAKKFIWVILRGGMDSIDTVVPTFEKSLKRLRPKLMTDDAAKLLPLDNGFALHPSLVNLHSWYKQGEFSPVVAVGSGYNERSHFDGQDFLESGKPDIDHESGWLARAVNIKDYSALSIANSVPVSLRDTDNVSTWYPTNLKSSTQEIYRQLNVLYQEDEVLLSRLEEGMDIRNMSGMDGRGKRRHNFKDLCESCAKLLTGTKSFDCATLEIGGWDTHNNQKQRLARALSELDVGLATLRSGLGDAWKDTVIVCATEFGRTVRENGTSGTDHGTASAMFVMGGAVNGGKVLGSWPGLEDNQLYQNRDLMPTTNSLAWLATIFQQHWGVGKPQIATIFPEISPYNTRILS